MPIVNQGGGKETTLRLPNNEKDAQEVVTYLNYLKRTLPSMSK